MENGLKNRFRAIKFRAVDIFPSKHLTRWHELALEKLLEHEVVVHRVSHDLGHVSEPELDEGKTARRSGFSAPAETEVGHAAKLENNFNNYVNIFVLLWLMNFKLNIFIKMRDCICTGCQFKIRLCHESLNHRHYRNH